jgi:hypothetical protein
VLGVEEEAFGKDEGGLSRLLITKHIIAKRRTHCELTLGILRIMKPQIGR